MAEENELDLIVDVPQQINRDDKRIETLSSKVKETSQQRDEAIAKVAASEKEVAFYKGFSGVSAKYQGAAEFQDKILEKVNAGYDLEDATVSVLNKEGKLMPPAPPPPAPAAGGSALVNIPENGIKSAGEMTQAERRSALLDAEKHGDISI